MAAVPTSLAGTCGRPIAAARGSTLPAVAAVAADAAIAAVGLEDDATDRRDSNRPVDIDSSSAAVTLCTAHAALAVVTGRIRAAPIGATRLGIGLPTAGIDE